MADKMDDDDLGGVPVDVAVVGAGAAGLSAALQAAAAGLSVTLFEETERVGGAAGRLVRVEIVQGSPIGMTGVEWARRADAELERSGVSVRRSTRVVEVRGRHRARLLTLADGSIVAARVVIAATGAELSPFEIEGAQDLCGAGVYRGVPTDIPSTLERAEVLVWGERNAAVEAALRLADRCRRVVVLSEEMQVGARLREDLRRRVRSRLNVSARPSVQIVELVGAGSLEAVILRDRTDGRLRVRSADALFVLDREIPRSDWLSSDVSVSPDGHVVTGGGLDDGARIRPPWHRRLPTESSLCGVFAAGAVRAGADPGFRGASEDGIAAARDAVARLRDLSACTPAPHRRSRAPGP